MTEMPQVVEDAIESFDESRCPMGKAKRLIVFARHPEIGKVKTRLIPALGAEAAAKTHFVLAKNTLATARQLMVNSEVDLEVRVTGNKNHSFAACIGNEVAVRSQPNGDLGERLQEAARAAFQEGVKRLVFVGTDCPDLSEPLLEEAFAKLDQTDLVLGPAFDGGYYLIGMGKFLPSLFQDIAWGSERVLEQTLSKAKQLQLRVSQLPPLSDVDYPEDLILCRNRNASFENVFPKPTPGLLSIIIPTRNEARTLGTTLSALTELDISNVEVIVADGESSDATVAVAKQFDEKLALRVVPVRKGRGRQMNVGAAISRGEALMFLHADTKLPGNFVDRVWATLNQGAIAGAFKLGIAGSQLGLRFVESGANFRSRFFQMPYGDQSLFLLSDLFFEIGGYRHWPLMEDYDLCQRLRKRGKITIADESITTSDRRWRELGVLRTTLLNQFYIAAFRLGVSPARIAKWYRAAKPKAK